MERRYSPRQEANPIIGYENLSSDQKKILADVHEWLASLLSFPRKTKDEAGSFLPRLDDNRTANVLLIDGGRGIGKTTILLTLLRMWADALRDTAEGALGEVTDVRVTDLLTNRRIIPLGVLDMQPLSGRPALLLQLAGRLYRVAEQLIPSQDKSAPEFPRLLDDDSPASFLAWRTFARAVAIGQEDDPHKRRSEMNPEDFAIELEQAERQRMRIVEQWHRFVDDLLKDLRIHKEKLLPLNVGDDPCFIVPVDDADMNPERGVELLELLRSLWHPRVVFLLTGDSDLFRHLLHNHYKKICPVLPDAKARNLALDVLGKVIPPAQRLRCRVTTSDSYDYLLKARVLHPELERRLARADLRVALPQRWRVLKDLEQSMRAERLTAIEVTHVFFEEAVKGSALSEEDQERLLISAFKRTPNGKGWRVQENVVQMQPASTELDTLSLDEQRAVFWNPAADESWFLRPHSSGSTSPEAGTTAENLPDAIVASLYLAASLASERPHSRIGGSLSPNEYGLISSKFSFGPVSYVFPWPTPQWLEPLLFREFLDAWRDGVTQDYGTLASGPGQKRASLAQQDALERLAALWLETICAMAGHKIEESGTATAASDEDSRRRHWFAIGTCIARIARGEPSPRTQTEAFVWWARNEALFFAAKESGLRQATRTALIDGWLETMSSYIVGEQKDQKYWAMVGYVLAGRIRRIERASINQGPLNEQITHAATKIEARSIKELFLKNKDSIESLKKYVATTYSVDDPHAVLAIALDGMPPDATGIIERRDSYAYLFPGEFVTGLLRQEHYRKHVSLQMSKIWLSAIPAGLERPWGKLWARTKNQFEVILANMASESGFLSEISAKDAKAAWRTVIHTYVCLSIPKLATSLECEIDRLLQTRDFFPRMKAAEPSAETKTHTFQQGKAPFLLHFRMPKLDYGSIQLFLAPAQGMMDMTTSTLLVMVSALYDIVMDEEDSFISLDTTPFLNPILVTAIFDQEFPVPLPAWTMTYDLRTTLQFLESIIESAPIQVVGIEEFCWICGFILFAISSIFHGRQMPSYQSYMDKIRNDRAPSDSPDGYREQYWKMVNDTVALFYYPPLVGHRAAVAREWANLGAPLLAAPESGMSSGSASHWLHAWDGTDNSTERTEVCQRLSEFRMKRAQAALGAEGTEAAARELLNKIDAECPDHAWVTLIERKRK